MSREKSVNRIRAFELFKLNKDIHYISITLGISESQIRKWKSVDNWKGNITNENTVIGNKYGNTKSNTSNINGLNGNMISNITNQSVTNEIFIQNLIDQLKEKDFQLNKKDEQIREKDIQIKEIHKLLENTQILFKNSQDMLISSTRSVPEKEIAVDEVIAQKEHPEEVSITEEKRSFLSKIFKRR